MGLPVRACLAAVALVLAAGCATYHQDLERARHHYESREFAKALAILRVLGEDEDALGEVERAQYAYLRGMTDLRLSAVVPPDDPGLRQTLRACARNWLEKSLASPRTEEGPPLSNAQILRAREALAEIAALPVQPGRCDDGSSSGSGH